MNTIIVNGTRTQVTGRNIVISNGRITVDGVLVADELHGDVNVKFEGDLASLNATQVEVSGSVNGNVDCTRLIVHGNIIGDVDGTNITANIIHGDVDAVSVKMR